MKTESDISAEGGIISWMAKNGVAPQILMVLFLVGGIIVSYQMKWLVWPNSSGEVVSVSVAYPGAGPAEVEDQVLLPLEDALRGITGIQSLVTNASEGMGFANISLVSAKDSLKVVQDIKDAIDRIITFPPQAEPPVVRVVHYGSPLMTLMVYGQQDYRAVRGLAERLQDDLSADPIIGGAQLAASSVDEISVEIPIMMLRAYNLTLDGVAATIKESSVNYPAGEIYAKEGTILLQSTGRRDSERSVAEIPIATTADGTVLKLGDVAKIRDGLPENDSLIRFNGLPAASLNIYQNIDVSPQQVATRVKEHIEKLKQDLPPTVQVVVWKDTSDLLAKRTTYLKLGSFIAFILVTAILAALLEIRLALRVACCIPVAVCGSFIISSFFGVTLNMISICTFLVAVGTVIDNGIVVGESVYKRREDSLDFLSAAQIGAKAVIVPIIFSVLVNSIVFLPLLFIPGDEGKFFYDVPIVAISIFAISMIQTLFILPSQLAGKPIQWSMFDYLNRPKIQIIPYIERFIAKVYIPFVHKVLLYRHKVLIISSVLLFVSVAMVFSGVIAFSPAVRNEDAVISIDADLGQVATDRQVLGVTKKLYAATKYVLDNSLSWNEAGVLQTISGNTISMQISLPKQALMKSSIEVLSSKIYERSNRIAHFRSFSVNGLGAQYEAHSLSFVLSHRSSKLLEAAAKDLASSLRGVTSVVNVDDGLSKGKRQFEFEILPSARSVGITSSELGRQIRSAFYGAEALRKARGRNETRIMVRLPRSERSSLNTLNNLIVKDPLGHEMFLSEAALIKESTTDSVVQRLNGRRQITIFADVASGAQNTGEIYDAFHEKVLPQIAQKYPGLSFSVESNGDSRRESKDFLAAALFAPLFIYTLLAILFRSYLQPLLILAVLPFEMIPAVFTHWILRIPLGLSSVFGILALTGIVVNTAMMMLVTANNHAQKGFTPVASIRLALLDRFRPVLLTSVATFMSVVPFFLLTDSEGKNLVPMLISLGGGAIFNPFISLSLVPALYLFSEELKRKANRFVAALHKYLEYRYDGLLKNQ